MKNCSEKIKKYAHVQIVKLMKHTNVQTDQIFAHEIW